MINRTDFRWKIVIGEKCLRESSKYFLPKHVTDLIHTTTTCKPVVPIDGQCVLPVSAHHHCLDRTTCCPRQPFTMETSLLQQGLAGFQHLSRNIMSSSPLGEDCQSETRNIFSQQVQLMGFLLNMEFSEMSSCLVFSPIMELIILQKSL